MNILNELTRWGEKGYAIALYYGLTFYDGKPARGWTCTLHYSPGGSVSMGYIDPPFGYHPTDATEAARIALRQAGERWPDMMVEL